jgi:membrane protease YdiL (CAAX protease family)
MKEAMFDLANEPFLFWLAFPAIAIGAPLIEELIFRGYLFSALATSRAGLSGATLITTSLWSLLHITEPWFAIGMIFVMGLVLSALLIRFGSIWLTMACHAAWNGANTLTLFLALQP